MSTELLRSMPSIERLLQGETARRLAATLSRERVRDLLREITDELRREMIGVRSKESVARLPEPDSDSLRDEIEPRLEPRPAVIAKASLNRVINATGVIIHPNLGRAPLARSAIDANSDED